MPRPTTINIDLNALVQNQARVRQYAHHAKMICCVKANAYGHGIVEVAKALASNADALAVASIEEAIALRQNGLTLPVLLLEGFFAPEELTLISELDLWSVVYNRTQVQHLKHYSGCKEHKRPIDTWFKIDTGMHRLGFTQEDINSVYNDLKSISAVGNIRLMTHFACADELENSFTEYQIGQFNQIASYIKAECSMANSAAIIAWPNSHREWVRPGYMLYGLSPFGSNHCSAKGLEPVMSFQTKVIDIKKIATGEGVGYNQSWRATRTTDIAILAVGYGDGYPRNSKNGAPVLVAGQKAKTVGHVAMDMMTVDITNLHSVKIGTDVELWGKNLNVHDVAAYSGYSPYELLTRIPPRVQRKYS